MARKKVNLTYISNDSTRRATFKKRKKGLIKKASELSVLCAVKACVVIYGPQDPEPEAWPTQADCRRVLSLFKSMPEMEQCKKMVDQEGFLRQRVSKSQEQLRKNERENRELEMNLLMHDALSSQDKLQAIKTLEDITCLALMIEIRLKMVQDAIDQAGKVVQEGKKEEGSSSLPFMEGTGIQGWYNNVCTEEMMMMMVQTYNDGPCPGGEYYNTSL